MDNCTWSWHCSSVSQPISEIIAETLEVHRWSLNTRWAAARWTFSILLMSFCLWGFHTVAAYSSFGLTKVSKEVAFTEDLQGWRVFYESQGFDSFSWDISYMLRPWDFTINGHSKILMRGYTSKIGTTHRIVEMACVMFCSNSETITLRDIKMHLPLYRPDL